MAGVYLQGGGALATLFDVLVPSWKFIKPYIIYIQLGLPLPPLLLDNLTLPPPLLEGICKYISEWYLRRCVTHVR